MGAQLKIDTSKTKQNNDVGRFTTILKGLSSSQTEQFLESSRVLIGGFEWMLGVKPDFQCDVLELYLFSWNDVAVYADVKLVVQRKFQAGDKSTDLTPKTAIPFCSIITKTFDPDELPDLKGRGLEGLTLYITAHLRNIRKAEGSEETEAKKNNQTIHLAVIDNYSIRNTLNQGSTNTIILSQHRRYSDLWSRSLVNLWARKHLDYRYWLCKHSGDGHVIITRCLSEAPVFERFEKICVPDDEGRLWVTVFREKKKSNESFQSFDENTILIFCLVWDPIYDDASSYCGHLLVQKSMLFYKLSEKLAEMASVFDGEDRSVHVYNGTSRAFKPPQKSKSTVEECGVCSGSVCIVEKLSEEQGTGSEVSSDHERRNGPSSVKEEEGEDCKDRGGGENADGANSSNLQTPPPEDKQTNTQNTAPNGSSQNAAAATTEPASISPVYQTPDSPASLVEDPDVTEKIKEIPEENSQQKPESKKVNERAESGLSAEAAKSGLCQAMLTFGLQQSFSNEAMPGIHPKIENKVQQFSAKFSASLFVKYTTDGSKEIDYQEQNYDNPKTMAPVSTENPSVLNEQEIS